MTTPKIELHVHLEGTIHPDPEITAYRDLHHFIDIWNETTASLKTPNDFHELVVAYAAEARRHGAVYLEGIFTPDPTTAGDIGLDRLFDAYCDGAAEAERDHGVIVRLTPEQCRGGDPDFGLAVARTAVRFRDRGVVGFGLSGWEGRYPDAPYLPAMRLAFDGGLGLVPHAGEAAGPDSVRSALRMGAARIRHGVRAVEDPDLVAELADRGIVLDVCPTSNIRLQVTTLADHPLRALAAAGVRCSISTDDPALFGTDLSTEYALAEECGVTAAAAYRAGWDGALCDAATKRRLPPC